MLRINYRVATEKDITFLDAVYNENMAALHGVSRTCAYWQEQLTMEDRIYYIVSTDAPVAWFRLEGEGDTLWLGMLQVKSSHQRRGIGRGILSVIEGLAMEQGFCKIGIHTTEDNLPARGLYQSAGYALTEVGPCSTADGIERVGYTYEKKF